MFFEELNVQADYILQIYYIYLNRLFYHFINYKKTNLCLITFEIYKIKYII